MVEFDWDSVVELAGVTIHVYKPQHWGRRLPWESFQRGYNSYLFEKNGKKVFFCGDSAYCDMFGHVGEKHDVDIALLPIGAYNPPSFRKVHMDPHDALRAYYDLQAELLIPMHWGNFRLSREPMKEPAWLLGELARERRLSGIQILQNGHSHTVD